MFNQGIKLPFRLLGIPLYLEWSFLVILPLLALSIGGRAGPMGQLFGLPDPAGLTVGATPYILGFTAALGLFIGVVLHELGHALTAQSYGVRVERISLWFLGGVAQFETMPRQRLAEAVVAIAGPVVSFALAAFCWFIQLYIPHNWDAVRFLLLYLTSMNLVLGLFNLLPALPLDGGRVLRSVLAAGMSFGKATRIAARVSRILALLMGVYGLLTGNYLLAVVAVFVFIAGSAEAASAQMEESLSNIPIRSLMNPNVATIPPETRIGELSELVWRYRHNTFPVADFAGRAMGVIRVDEIQGHDALTQVSDVMKPASTIHEDATAADAYIALLRSESSSLIVTDSLGRIVGFVTQTDLERAIQLRRLIRESTPPHIGRPRPA